MGRGLGEIVTVLTQMLPPWAVALIAGVVLVVAVPGWLHSMRTRQIRSAIRRLVRAEGEEADALFARAFDRAGADPHLLALVVAESRKRVLPQMTERALTTLDTVPGGAHIAAGLRAEVAAKTADPMHPVEAIVRIETLLEQGAVEAARARLGEALDMHPSHPELIALTERIAAEG